jgi:YYY domain-containing protein
VLHPLLWFLAVEFLGLLVFPLTFTLFHRLPDRGYTFSKPLVLILLSYLLWMLGLTHTVPISRSTIMGVLLLMALASAWVLRRNHQPIKRFVRSQWPVILVAEGVFLVLFLLWLGIVSEVPAIDHTEKPMDFAFLNAILQSRYFPPEDPWLAGHPISYYYFGHFMMASVTKLTAVPPAIGYNIAISLVPALLGIGVFGLMYNLVRLSGGTLRAGLRFGLLAPALLMLVGNLEGVLEFVHVRGWGGDSFWEWVGVKGLEGASGPAAGIFPEQSWWWWRATRVIDTVVDGQSLDYTITEFPFFSFILGDLHPHVMGLPFLVMFLALTLNLYISPEKLGPGWLLRRPVPAGAMALMLGALAFINIWDFPVFAVVLALVVFARSYGQQDPCDYRDTAQPLARAAVTAFVMVTPLVLAAIVLYLPFYRDLSSQASGILPVTGPGTRPLHFFLVIGLPVVLSLSFLLRQIAGLPRARRHDAPTILLVTLLTLIPLVLWVLITVFLALFTDGVAASTGKVGSRLVLVVPGLVVAGLAAFSVLQRALYNQGPVAVYPLLLAAVAFYLLVGAELFFLADFFGNRMNTIFKVYFQSWLLLTIAGTYGLYYWQAHWQTIKMALRVGQYAGAGLIVLMVVASLYYPVGAVLSRTGVLGPAHTLRDNSLDGLAFGQESDPGEYDAIRWLREEAPRGRIVEAVGNDYSPYGRISASTGLPTILGWKGHEHQWRGTTTVFQGREEEVSQIYQSDDPEVVGRLLERYDIRYVYVGTRERAKYDPINLEKFDGLLRIAFKSQGVIIYERLNPITPTL